MGIHQITYQFDVVGFSKKNVLSILYKNGYEMSKVKISKKGQIGYFPFPQHMMIKLTFMKHFLMKCSPKGTGFLFHLYRTICIGQVGV